MSWKHTSCQEAGEYGVNVNTPTQLDPGVTVKKQTSVQTPKDKCFSSPRQIMLQSKQTKQTPQTPKVAKNYTCA